MIRLPAKVAPAWYTPESERNDPQPTRFLCNPLPASVLVELNQHRFPRADGEEGITGAGILLTLRRGISDVENLAGPDGKVLEHYTAAALYDLPPSIMMELALHLIAGSTLSEGERKKSPPPSKLPATRGDSDNAAPAVQSAATG